MEATPKDVDFIKKLLLSNPGIVAVLYLKNHVVPGIVTYANGSFSRLHRVGGSDAMAESILEFYNDRQKAFRERERKKARDHACKKFAWEVVTEKLVSLYNHFSTT